MGAIEEIYADLDTDVSEAEFREAVEQKVEQMEGLVDEETAAEILAHELADSEVDAVADVDPAMDEVKFLAKVRSIGDLRTFERDDGEGRVINVEAADETGTVRLAFWDEQAAEIDDGELETGDVLRVKGRPKEGYNGLEVSVDKAEPDDDVEIDVDITGSGATIDALTLGQSDVTLQGLVLGTDSVRTFDRDDGSEGKVANLTLGDETGRIRVTLWDERADQATELDPGTAVEVVDGYVRERDGDLELHVGDQGAVEAIDETIEYEPDATPVDDVEIGERVDLAGVVRSADPKRTFDRDDGSEGQVRNVRLQDDTDDIRIALWGGKADLDVAPGDELLAANVEIQDGWQDDLEASAGWQSTVVVLDDATAGTGTGEDAAGTTAAGGDDGAVSDGGAAGLDAFADGTSPDGESASGTGAESNSASGTGAESNSASGTGADGEERVEFTGTVVQTGEPVVLDDGAETMSVETDARLRLGEEVTVRGRMDGDRLDADEVL
jgi:replication factor A1